MCTASQASLLGHPDSFALRCAAISGSRTGFTGGGKGSFGQWAQFGIKAFLNTVVFVMAVGTAFGHEPQLIHCTRTANL